MPRTQTATSESEIEQSFRDLNPIGEGPRIRLDRAALRLLESQVREGIRAINGRGVEVGGLILGPAINWTASQVVIDGFLPVESEHRFGPAFRPSEADLAVFKEALASSGGKVIGYFRSQLHDDNCVRPEDLKLLAQLFPKSDSCFLSIHAGLNAPSNVDLYQVRPGKPPELWELFALKEREPTEPAEAAKKPAAPPADQQVSPEANSVPASSREKGSAPLRPPAPQPVSKEESSPAPSTGPDEHEALLDESAPPGDKHLLRTTAGVVVALAITTAAFTLGRRTVSPPHPSSAQEDVRLATPVRGNPGIGLRIAERGLGLEIRWNAAGPSITTAARGVLIITDGPGTGDVTLTPEQIRSGLYLYKPVRNTLTVLLMIYQPDGSFTGDTREFTGTHALPEPSASYPTLPAITRRPVKQLPPPPSVTPPERPKAAASPVPAKAAPRSFSAQRTAPAATAASVPALLEPPPATANTVPGAIAQLPAMALPSPPPVAQQHPNLTYHATTTRFIAPQMTHQAIPAIPLGVAPRIRTEVQLEVMVTLDTEGKVTGAHVVSSKGPAAGLLAIEALKAAQLCRFLPAQEDGHPVPGSATVTFRFAPRPN